MHLLGKEMVVNANLPDGVCKQLVSVQNWDFFWQTMYEFRDPVKLPKDTLISLVAHFDNSSMNAKNPHLPPKDIYWGEQTADEMCAAFIGFTVDSEELTKGIRAPKVNDEEFGDAN